MRFCDYTGVQESTFSVRTTAREQIVIVTAATTILQATSNFAVDIVLAFFLIVGGVVGGVLGHQIGSGRGNDVATAVGAVGGAAVGANVNRGTQVQTQDVQRCAAVPGSARPQYWHVTYVFRGQTHRAQLSFAPGATSCSRTCST